MVRRRVLTELSPSVDNNRARPTRVICTSKVRSQTIESGPLLVDPLYRCQSIFSCLQLVLSFRTHWLPLIYREAMELTDVRPQQARQRSRVPVACRFQRAVFACSFGMLPQKRAFD